METNETNDNARRMTLETLSKIQGELIATKEMNNAFGGYKYRSAESILASVKPLLRKYSAAVVMEDDIEEAGGRVYVKATATLHVTGSSFTISSSARAREPLARKGMDEAQCTGSSSSYARKYALCGLFAIDDSRGDPDRAENDEAHIRGQIEDCRTIAELNKLYRELVKAKPNSKEKLAAWCKAQKLEIQAADTQGDVPYEFPDNKTVPSS